VIKQTKKINKNNKQKTQINQLDEMSKQTRNKQKLQVQDQWNFSLSSSSVTPSISSPGVGIEAEALS
jgi:hypothetical protein